MSRLVLGIPMKWLLALLATLVGGAAVVGTGAVVVVLAVVQGDDVLPPVSELPVIEVVLEDPVDLPITVTVPETSTVPAASPVVPTNTVPLTLPIVLTVTVPTTSPVVMTVTVPITPPIVSTDTVPSAPIVVLTKPGRSGLAFHPAHLNAGGKCREVYVARGSLKNHGPALATGVVIEIDEENIVGKEWVDHVEVTVTPSEPFDLDTSKPARFTVSVYTNDEWHLAPKGARIEVRLFVAGEESMSDEEGTEAVFVVKNRCKPEKPEKPAKPEKPEKPVKPEKPAKPEKPPKPEKPAKPKKDK